MNTNQQPVFEMELRFRQIELRDVHNMPVGWHNDNPMIKMKLPGFPADVVALNINGQWFLSPRAYLVTKEAVEMEIARCEHNWKSNNEPQVG